MLVTLSAVVFELGTRALSELWAKEKSFLAPTPSLAHHAEQENIRGDIPSI